MITINFNWLMVQGKKVDPNKNTNLLGELDDSNDNEESAHIDGMLDDSGDGDGGDDGEASMTLKWHYLLSSQSKVRRYMQGQ
jgi:hypothetical protein